jgi:hypothetical protein
MAPEEEYLSKGFRHIMRETNLISSYNPNYEEGLCASVLACAEFEEYLRNPKDTEIFSADRTLAVYVINGEIQTIRTLFFSKESIHMSFLSFVLKIR